MGHTPTFILSRGTLPTQMPKHARPLPSPGAALQAEMRPAGEEWVAPRVCRGEKELAFTDFHFLKTNLSGHQANSGIKVAQRGVHHREGGQRRKRGARVPDLCPLGLLRSQDERPQEERIELSVQVPGPHKPSSLPPELPATLSLLSANELKPKRLAFKTLVSL